MTLQPVTILLAGGKSARFGRDKPTIVIGGETLVERHLRQAKAANVSRFIVVANRDNISEITQIVGKTDSCSVEVCLQEGANLEGAVLTGLRRVTDGSAIYISCTNDIVPDDTYIRLRQKSESGSGLIITTATLKWRFTGGTLVLQKNPKGERLLSIKELGSRECWPGSSVNVLVHLLAGADLNHRIIDSLNAGLGYEVAINNLIASGVSAEVVRVVAWVGVKVPADLVRVHTEFGLTCS